MAKEIQLEKERRKQLCESFSQTNTHVWVNWNNK